MSELVAFNMLWKVIDTAPFDASFDMNWLIEFGAPDPDCFIVAGTSRVSSRMRIRTSTGRYP